MMALVRLFIAASICETSIVQVDIDQHRPRPRQDYGLDRSDEGMGHGDYLVSGADTAGAKRHLQRVRPRADADGELGTAIGGEIRLQSLDVLAEIKLHPVQGLIYLGQYLFLDSLILAL
jgi:hypothetical protein